MKTVIHLLVLLAVTGCTSVVLADEATWHAAPSLKFARAAHAVVSNGQAIYALAGTGTGGRPVLEVERFDGTAWQIETRLPGRGLNAPAAAIFQDRIYLIGGFNTTTNVPARQVLVYDIKLRKWSEAAPLPAPRGGHAAVVFQNRIHVVGGGNSVSTLADHSVYDFATNTWSQSIPLPRAEGSPAVAVHRDKLYVIGGRSGYSDYGDVYLYDGTSKNWTNGPAIDPRGTAGAVVFQDAVHLFGGESQALKRCLGDVFRLDPKQMTWQQLKPMPTPRNFARAVIFQEAVYVVGGSVSAGSSHTSTGSTVVERFGK